MISTELFVDGQVLCSEETQRDPLSMSMYALVTICFVDQLSDVQDVTQVWYADNASAAGNLTSNLKWCDCTNSLALLFGYHANDCKTWLIA